MRRHTGFNRSPWKANQQTFFRPTWFSRNIIRIASTRSALLVAKCANKAPMAFVGVQVVEKLQPHRFAPIHITIFPSAVPAGEQKVDSALLAHSIARSSCECECHCVERVLSRRDLEISASVSERCTESEKKDACNHEIEGSSFLRFASAGWLDVV
jgi:hypothetical protein